MWFVLDRMMEGRDIDAAYEGFMSPLISGYIGVVYDCYTFLVEQYLHVGFSAH